MTNVLRNMNIGKAINSVILLFILSVGVIAALGWGASRMADNAIRTLSQINVEQLNGISRAEAALNQARFNLEVARHHIGEGRIGNGKAFNDNAGAQLNQAAEGLARFLDSVQTARGQALAEALTADFQAMMTLMQQQQQALAAFDIDAANGLREQAYASREALDGSMSAFVSYADGQGAALMADYESRIVRYSWVGLLMLLVTVLVLVLVHRGLRRVLIAPLQIAVDNLEHIARSDLSQDIRVLSRNEIGKLFAAMRDMQHGLLQTVGTVRDSSVAIHRGASDIAGGNGDLSSRTEQQAASLEETAASMEQLTTTVRQNADNARQASTLAQAASNTASHGGEVVEQVVSTMGRISDSSQKIADITGLIDSIAFQTNILALNASVEAARAGEQGRGFAVVAGEVRNLAGRSADAAREIKGLIENSVTQVEDGSRLVAQAGETMTEIVAAVKRVTDIMDEISAASQEQSQGIEQVSLAVGQMDEVTQQNAALVQQAAAAAISLESQASRLAQAVAVFRLPAGARPQDAEPHAEPEQRALAPVGHRAALAGDWEAF
ncbi:methyl-accepting chemotaxis protein [Zobellella maritima]|uniref:methyl-accepting chemotaxis protein n=1 Tax=Zobellella maritima TaxID=2059725 RepID=UPI0022B7D959|nr:methyl-accepting chemotaxis protein [Zobellella maritima]